MAKIALKLEDDGQCDFILIGIVCQNKDYRLCYELNNKLQIDLTKQKDYEIFSSKRMQTLKFSFYQYKNGDGDAYHIFSNKGSNGLLVPEQNQVDYFLMIIENFKRIDTGHLTNTLKEIPIVLGVYKMEVPKLKSKENFLF